jgi:hypothetical protein
MCEFVCFTCKNCNLAEKKTIRKERGRNYRLPEVKVGIRGCYLFFLTAEIRGHAIEQCLITEHGFGGEVISALAFHL